MLAVTQRRDRVYRTPQLRITIVRNLVFATEGGIGEVRDDILTLKDTLQVSNTDPTPRRQDEQREEASSDMGRVSRTPVLHDSVEHTRHKPLRVGIGGIKGVSL